jgi:hypothetical protein
MKPEYRMCNSSVETRSPFTHYGSTAFIQHLCSGPHFAVDDDGDVSYLVVAHAAEGDARGEVRHLALVQLEGAVVQLARPRSAAGVLGEGGGVLGGGGTGAQAAAAHRRSAMAAQLAICMASRKACGG